MERTQLSNLETCVQILIPPLSRLDLEKTASCLSFLTLFFFLIFLEFILLVFYLFLFLAVLGLRCCAQAFSSFSEQELLFVVVCGLLTAVASRVAEHGL